MALHVVPLAQYGCVAGLKPWDVPWISVCRIGHVPEMPHRPTALANAQRVAERPSDIGLRPAHGFAQRYPAGEIGTDSGREGTAGAMRVMRVYHLTLQQFHDPAIIKNVRNP